MAGPCNAGGAHVLSLGRKAASARASASSASVHAACRLTPGARAATKSASESRFCVKKCGVPANRATSTCGQLDL